MISSYLPFPPISWWAYAADAAVLTLDRAEHFEKMSYRNRYRISGANNPIQLSLPLVSGRDQRSPMADVLLFNDHKWQVQQWRTLVSVYKQSPFWDYYESSLQALFARPFSHLTTFNQESILWVVKQLKMNLVIQETDIFIARYPNEITDLRTIKPLKTGTPLPYFPRYYQVFEDRVGFLPDLSILDLLFSEGPNALRWINDNRQALIV